MMTWIFTVCLCLSFALTAFVAYRFQMSTQPRFFDKFRYSFFLLGFGIVAAGQGWGVTTMILAFFGGIVGCFLFILVGLQLANRQLKREGGAS